MSRVIALAVMAALCAAALVALSAAAALGIAGTGAPVAGAGPPASRTPLVPPDWQRLDAAAAATCPGLAWAVPAAVGTVESRSGSSDLPGVWSGANAAGAEGPMQLEPATFAAEAVVGPGGAVPASPYDPVDAVYTAVHLLCSDGAGASGGLAGAVWDYDHDGRYVHEVLALAIALGADPSLPTDRGLAILSAAGDVGTPYRWGGTGPDGFDCSGLVQAAYAAGGVTLPRVAQAQFDAGPAVPVGTPPAPGDLLFFGSGPAAVTHVGLYLGEGVMVDAPHTGAEVRVEAAGWSDLVGVTAPG